MLDAVAHDSQLLVADLAVHQRLVDLVDGHARQADAIRRQLIAEVSWLDPLGRCALRVSERAGEAG